MDKIVDLIATDANPSEISDAIKNEIYVRAAEKIDAIRPYVADAMFGGEGQNEYEEDGEVEGEDYSQEEE